MKSRAANRRSAAKGRHPRALPHRLPRNGDDHGPARQNRLPRKPVQIVPCRAPSHRHSRAPTSCSERACSAMSSEMDFIGSSRLTLRVGKRQCPKKCPPIQGRIERFTKLLPAWNEGFWSIFWHPALENTQKRDERF